MANWIPGQSGNPNGRARRGRSVAELARAIAQERVEFSEPWVLGQETKTLVYTRLERLVRVIWTMALDGKPWAIRCLLEYMEGKPAQIPPAPARTEGGDTISADKMAALVSSARARLEAWRQDVDGETLAPGGADEPQSTGRNG